MNKVLIAKLIEREGGTELNVDFNDLDGNDSVMIIAGLVMKLSEATGVPTEFIQRDVTLFVAENKARAEALQAKPEAEGSEDVQ